MTHLLACTDWQGSAERSLSFCQECRAAVDDDQEFAQFKCKRWMRGIVENKPPEWIDSFVNTTRVAAPWILDRIATVCENDTIGKPKLATTSDGKYTMSPTTAAYMVYMAMIDWLFGPLKEMRIAEIGAGYGGLCRLIMALCQPKSYVLYDLPDVLALQAKYLDALGCHNIEYRSEVGEEGSFDLIISTSAFTELTRPTMDVFGERIFAHCGSGFIAGCATRQAGDDVPTEPHEIEEWFAAILGPNRLHWGRDNSAFTTAFQAGEPNWVSHTGAFYWRPLSRVEK